MNFQKTSEKPYTHLQPGMARRTLVHGERTLLAEFAFERGAILPSHSHPHEQTGYLVSGRMMLTIGDTEYDVHPGDAWIVPGGVLHGAQAVEDCVAVEVFSPVREDYLT